MRIKILFIALLFSAYSWGQSSIATMGLPVTENFNGLSNSGTTTWTDGGTTGALGWYAKTTATSPIPTYAANTGTTLGVLSSYGSSASGDRALGMSNTNAFTGSSGAKTGYFGWRLKNNTGSSISSITVVWTGEQWRKANVNVAHTLILSYQTSTSAITDLTAGSWTASGSTFSSPIFSAAAAAALDGNLAANRTANITITISVALAAGDEIMLRWEDVNDANNDHLMGVDDVSVTAVGLTTAKQSGAWSDVNTWDTGVVPPVGGNVLIPSPWIVWLTATGNPTTRNTGTTTTVDPGATLRTDVAGGFNNYTFTNNGTAYINGTFQIDNDGTANGTGTFVYGAAGTLNFNNTASSVEAVAGTPVKTVVTADVFWPTVSPPFNVSVVGELYIASGARTIAGTLTTATNWGSGINGASLLTVTGTTRINAGGRFTGTGPIYTSSPASLLLYNTGGNVSRGPEFAALPSSSTIGTTQGYPNNVQISNTTNFRYNSSTAQKGIYGNLTIDNGSTLDMTFGTQASVDFLVGGTGTTSSVTNNGTFKFSNPTLTAAASVVVTGDFTNGSTGIVTMGNNIPLGGVGGHLKLGGNFSNSGTFTGNNKSVYFTKTGTQTITSSTALTFPYVLTAASPGPTTIQLLSNLAISSPSAAVNGGVALTLANSGDVFDLNGKTLIIGTAAVANTVSLAGSLKGGFVGATYSGLNLLGNGSIGTLKFAGDLNLGTFTMNRQNATVGCVMGSDVTVNTSLVLSKGLIDLGAYIMTLPSTCSNTFTATGNSFVVANATAGGLLKIAIPATGTTYNFPIGDATGTVQYSPATVNYTSGTVDATSFLGLSVDNSKESNFPSTTEYLNRYWSLTNSGTFTTPVYTFTGTYTNAGGGADIFGTFPVVSSNFKSNQWDGSDWTNNGTSIGTPSTGTLTKTGCTLVTGTNHITAGIRDREIEVKSGLTLAGVTLPNGSIATNGNAAFATQTVASNTAHNFSIHNRGGKVLSLTNTPIVEIIAGSANFADFAVTTQPAATTINGEALLTFVITFTPSTSGYRWATVRIMNDDADESSYTFVVDGTGQCAVASTNTIVPDSGPVGTEVTITAVTNNLFSATASLNSVAATISSYSPSAATATVIKAIIPAGAVSGQLTTTNSSGCKAMNYFTVIDNAITSCQGTGTARNKLFISEVTDHGSGSHSFIELWNATGGAINIAGYTIRVYYNGGSTFSTITIPSNANTTSFANNKAYVIGFGGGNAADVHGTYTADQTSGISGINSNDNIRLYDAGAVQIDQWGDNTSSAIFTISSKDYTYRRKNTGITAPSTTWNPNDWTAFTPVDYTDIGKYNYSAGILPSVNTLSYTPTCKAATLTFTEGEGFSGGNLLVHNWYAVPNGSNTWSLISDVAGVFSGATTNTLYIYDISSYLNYQFYCQVWEDTATCYNSSNAIKITAGPTATWQVSNTWSTGSAPDINTAVIIDNLYDTANGFSPSFDACSVTINSGKTVTIRANDVVTIQNDLTVTGTLNVESSGSLVMIDDNGVVTNTGTTEVKRTAAGIRGSDYVYWSSPVTGQSLNTIYSSPTPGYMFYWDPVGANINSPISTGNWLAASGVMSQGKGYIVRGSSNYGMAASSIPSLFSGAVNNGVVQPAIGRGGNTTLSTVGLGNGVTVTNFDDNWNLVGNPYPSAINAIAFLNYNTNLQGFIYLWKHNNLPVSLPNPFYGSFLYDYNPSDYLAYNKLGAQTQNGFDGYVASGQGFFILMNDGIYDTSQTATFKNSMRSKTYANTQFYKNGPSTTSTIDEETHRIWLDLVDSNNQSVRTLVGYASEATYGLDRLYDAFKNTANEMSIHSLAENKTLIIQGRALPFDQNDQVPIGVTVKLAGTYKIAIASVDGLFSEPTQNIYLEDKQLGVIYDLRQSPYTFDATAGIFNDRFVLRYTGTALSNPDFGTINNIILTSSHGQLSIKSSTETIQDVTVFDILGRQLFEAKAIGNKDFSTSTITARQQTLIVKIKLENGIITTRKIIL